MTFVILMAICLVIGLVDMTRFNLWLALGNIFTAINCFVTGQFLFAGIILVFCVSLVWWHFKKKNLG